MQTSISADRSTAGTDDALQATLLEAGYGVFNSVNARGLTSSTPFLMQTSISADSSPASTGEANHDATIASSPG